MFNRKLDYGDFVSNDRFYTIINQFIDDSLLKYSWLLCFCVAYLFRSSNFRHVNLKKRKIIFLIRIIDSLCWLCLVGFIGLTVTGISVPLISEIKNLNFHKFFQNSTITAILVLEVICISVSFFYIFFIRKKISVNKKMSIVEYVTSKIGLIMNLDFLFKIQNKIAHKNEKEKRLIRNKNFSTFILNQYPLINLEETKSFAELWLIMQVTNVMCYLFNDFNLILVIRNRSEDFIQKFQKVVNHDFQKLKILILE